MNLILNMLNRVNDLEPESFYNKVSEMLSKKEKMFVVTANPEIIMNGCNNEEVFGILSEKAVVIPDGIGVAKAVGALRSKKISRNTGVELVEFLLKECNKKNYRILIYGSKEEVLKSFKKKCDEIWPNIEFDGLYNGYDYTEKEVLNRIKESKPDVYLVALGSPKQELFINKFYERIENGVCVGVGGSLDVLSGHVKRAPKFFIKCNLEWLYRVATEPKRLKRFVNGNIKFLVLFIPELIRTKWLKSKCKK